jgi:hypothetical protein
MKIIRELLIGAIFVSSSVFFYLAYGQEGQPPGTEPDPDPNRPFEVSDLTQQENAILLKEAVKQPLAGEAFAT